MNMMKALAPSTILTLMLSALVGQAGAGTGFLNLRSFEIGGYVVYWSWTLFFAAMAINACLLLEMARREGKATAEPNAADA